MDTAKTHQRIKPYEAVFVTVVLVYALWSLYRIFLSAAPDFSVLYGSAKNLLMGRGLYGDTKLFTGLGYPPVSLLPYVPFVALPYLLSQVVWILGSFGAFLFTIYACLRAVNTYTRRNWMLWASVAFLSFPTKFTLGMGQANFYALAFLLLGVSEAKIHPFWRCMALLTALLLKPHLVLVYTLLLCTKYRQSVIWSVLSAGILTIILGVWNQGINEMSYLQDMVPTLTRFSGREIYYNQGIQSIIARTVGQSGTLVATVLCFTAAAFSVIAIVSKKKYTAIAILAIGLPMLLLIEPLSWQHHAVFLWPTYVLLFYNEKLRRSRVFTAFLIVSILLISWNIKNPVYWLQSPVSWVVLSHGFFGVLIAWTMAMLLL